MPKQTHRREVVRDNKGNRHFVSPMRDWKDALWVRQNSKCWICGELMVRKAMFNADGSHDGKHCTIDHLVPQNQGGSDDISNLALAHYSCNCLRGRNNLIPLGIRLNAAEVLITAKDAEIAVLITAKDAANTAKTESDRLLEAAARMHKFVSKQRDRALGQRDKAQESYTRLHSMIKPPPACICWWCRLKVRTVANFSRLRGGIRVTSGL